MIPLVVCALRGPGETWFCSAIAAPRRVRPRTSPRRS